LTHHVKTIILTRRVNIILPDNLHGIRTAIEKAVPHGRTDNGGKNDRGAWSEAPAHHLEVWAKMEPAYQAIID
jgi:tRNA-splicing ligase RtcB